MTEPILTIVFFEDCEKDPAMVKRFFYALRELNADALPQIQVIAVSQRQKSVELEQIGANPGLLNIEIVCAECPRADNGYPIWDICAILRQVRHRIRGRYTTFAHTEFFHGPGRLAATIEWLLRNDPLIALGNLRRLGQNKAHWNNRTQPPDPGITEILVQLIDGGATEWIAKLWDTFPTWHWAHWRKDVRGDDKWEEDVFYIKTEWMDLIRLIEHEDRLAFQDIYDIVGAAMGRLSREGLTPVCPRMPRITNEIFHLDHLRHRQAFSPVTHKWFMDHLKDWEGTTYARQDIWDIMLNAESDENQRKQAIEHFRRAPGGTVTRWLSKFSVWLQIEGAMIIGQYNDAHGKDSFGSIRACSSTPFEVQFIQDLIRKQNGVLYLEIGGYMGGSLSTFGLVMPKGSTLISIDKALNEQTKDGLDHVAEQMTRKGYNCRIIIGDSHDKRTVDQLTVEMDRRLADVLFIDGDHSVVGCNMDLDNYLPFVRPGGLVIMHDCGTADPARPLSQKVAGIIAGLHNIWLQRSAGKKKFMFQEWPGYGGWWQ